MVRVITSYHRVNIPSTFKVLLEVDSDTTREPKLPLKVCDLLLKLSLPPLSVCVQFVSQLQCRFGVLFIQSFQNLSLLLIALLLGISLNLFQFGLSLFLDVVLLLLVLLDELTELLVIAAELFGNQVLKVLDSVIL